YQTLKQLEFNYSGNIPYLTINDKPAFSYRGFMIDCARHFFLISDLKKMIDIAALFKFNKFHWHLVDDQGWRMEIKKYPLLTEKGSKRNLSNFGRYYDPNPHEGFYTQNQMKEIVEYCKKKSIDVIPEIEIPGHVSACLNAYPNLSCREKDVPVRTHGGIFKDILCAGKEEVYEFIFSVLDEMSGIFPSEYVHIGGDEAPKERWKECPHCIKKMESLKLKDYEQLQGYMMNRVYGYLQKKGKKAITWNESLRGGNLEKGITVQNWREKDDECMLRAADGGKIIVSDFFHYYLDYPLGMTPLKKTYMYDPIPYALVDSCKKNIIGVEAPIWTEFVKDIDKMSIMCFPRLAAVGETGWTLIKNKDYASFKQRLLNVISMIGKAGLKYQDPSQWDPGFLRSAGQILRFVNNMYNKETIRTRRKE
ncbi:MAG: family 20 glycosylhydrolase, partial [Clostridia bacterium]